MLLTFTEELVYLEEDIDRLERIWKIKVSFDSEIRNLYKTHFNKLETVNLHNIHQDYIKRISVFEDIKDKPSEVLGLL